MEKITDIEELNKHREKAYQKIDEAFKEFERNTGSALILSYKNVQEDKNFNLRILMGGFPGE